MDPIEVDGYAFKDLDRDGELDVFEDWRVDYKERSRDLVTNGGLSLEFQLGLKMNPFSVGTPAKTGGYHQDCAGSGLSPHPFQLRWR